jgi:allophanate hydrolase subunit 1
MPQEREHDNKALLWKTTDGKKSITSLQELLETLIAIPEEDIDEEISMNINKEEHKLVAWLEENFSQQLNLIEIVKNIQIEFTPQQIREKLIREMRMLT